MHLLHQYSEWHDLHPDKNECILLETGETLCFVELVRYCLNCSKTQIKLIQERRKLNI